MFRNEYRDFDAVDYVLQDINNQQLAGPCISPRISVGMIYWAQRPQADVRHVQEMGIWTRKHYVLEVDYQPPMPGALSRMKTDLE